MPLTKRNKTTLAYILVILAVLVIFQIRFGFQLLDISNYNWLMLWGSDRTPDFLAWEFYRITPWQFPVGIIEKYSWPNITSTGLTGSIPLLALPFKVLSPYLPEVVQYFGIWLFSCYLLQGLMAFLLIRAFHQKTPFLAALAAVLFILSPVLLQRTDHMNLCCHWIILISFWIYYKHSIKGSDTFFWHLLPVGVSGLSHPYLIVITLPMAMASFWKEWRITKTISLWQAATFIILQVLFVLGLWAINGNFVLESGSEKGAGFGYFSTNLNTFFNSLDKTLLLPGLPVATDGQYEGFAYLGAGMLFILLVLLILQITNKNLSKIPKLGGPILWVVIALAVFSLSNKITFFGMSARIPLPDFLESLGSTFRATGRYIWPLYYLINLAILVAFLRAKLPPALKWTVLILAIALQATDVSPLLDRQYITHKAYQPPINTTNWKKAADEADMFVMYPPYHRNYDHTGDFMYFAHEAYRGNIPITAGHLARYDQSVRDSFNHAVNELLNNQTLGSLNKSVFISTIDHTQRFVPLREKGIVDLYLADRYLLVIPKILSNLDRYFWNKSSVKSDTLEKESLSAFFKRHAQHTVFIVSKDTANLMACDSAVAYLKEAGATFDYLKPDAPFMGILHKGKLIFEKHHENKLLFHTFARNTQQGSLFFHKGIYLESGGGKPLSRGKIKLDQQEYSFQRNGLNLVVVDDQFNVLESIFFPTNNTCDQWQFNQVF